MPQISLTRLTMRSTDLLAVVVNVKGLTAVNAITIAIVIDQEAVVVAVKGLEAVDAITIVIGQDQEAVDAITIIIGQDQEAVDVITIGLTAVDVGASVQHDLRPHLRHLPRKLLSDKMWDNTWFQHIILNR